MPHKYGNHIKEIESKLLQCIDLFRKSRAEACRILTGWNSRYAITGKRFSDANNGVVFTTVSYEQKCNKKMVI